jgi:uncharacterized membrane protein YphA (DoxX/SURF4 family)
MSPHPHAIDRNYRTHLGANDLDMLFMQSLSFPHLVGASPRYPSFVLLQQEAGLKKEASVFMTGLERFAQILVVGIFLFAGLSKIFAFRREPQAEGGPSWRGDGFPRKVACGIALIEIAGALGLLVPFGLWQSDMLPRLAAAGLALLTLGVAIYHIRRKEPAAPMFALFLLTLLVIVGRWL